MILDNLIFMHIPKNGGTTFHTILERIYPQENSFSIKVINPTTLNINEFKKLTPEERGKIKLLKGHMLFGLHEYLEGTSKYIAFLRKPEDRIISYYYFAATTPDQRLYDQIKSENMSLYDFVTKINKGDVNNCQIRWISGLRDKEEIMLEKALENIENHFSFIGLVEKFDESLVLIKNKYGWKTPYYMVRNKTKNRIDASSLDEKTRNAINELNRGDNILYETMEKKFNDLVANHNTMSFELKRLRTYSKIYSTAQQIKKSFKPN